MSVGIDRHSTTDGTEALIDLLMYVGTMDQLWS